MYMIVVCSPEYSVNIKYDQYFCFIYFFSLSKLAGRFEIWVSRVDWNRSNSAIVESEYLAI